MSEPQKNRVFIALEQKDAETMWNVRVEATGNESYVVDFDPQAPTHIEVSRLNPAVTSTARLAGTAGAASGIATPGGMSDPSLLKRTIDPEYVFRTVASAASQAGFDDSDTKVGDNDNPSEGEAQRKKRRRKGRK